MMSSAMQGLLLDLLFLNTNAANIGDATGLRGSSTAGNFYLSLHVTDPGASGNQTTGECSYTGYARKAIPRSGSGFTRSGNVISNVAAITMDKCTGGSETAAYFGIGLLSSGAGVLIASGPLGGSVQGPFTAKADDTITIPGHSLSVNDRIAFYGVFGSALPTGMTEGAVYYVKTVSGDDITISTTQGGAAVNLTSVGDGVAFKADTLAISTNITPELAIGALVFSQY